MKSNTEKLEFKRAQRSLLMTYQGRLLREQIYCGDTPSEKRREKRLRRLRALAKYGRAGAFVVVVSPSDPYRGGEGFGKLTNGGAS